jgi:DNA-binding response OmpR family regulator
MASILVVEDDPDVLQFVCSILEDAGHVVDCLPNLTDGAHALASGNHDLVIADVRLPDGSGVDLADMAAAAGKKAVLIAGHPDDVRALAQGKHALLPKPFRPSQLIDLINDQLAGP